MSNPIRCAIIGQNPLRFPWGFDEEDDRCRKLKMELAQQIMVLRQSGVSQFLTACDCGVGLYTGEIINGLRMTDRDLMLICYTPHEEQATKWAPYLRERYFAMLEKCTLISAVCEVGAPDAQFQAYKKIIDGLIFVGPRQIPLILSGEMTECQRPLRAQTAQGERVSLANSEQIPAGSTCEFEITCMDDAHEKAVMEWLDYGKLRGLGQWRNSGKGRFTYEILG